MSWEQVAYSAVVGVVPNHKVSLKNTSPDSNTTSAPPPCKEGVGMY